MEWNGGMDWTGLDWTGLEWNGMEWNGMAGGMSIIVGVPDLWPLKLLCYTIPIVSLSSG